MAKAKRKLAIKHASEPEERSEVCMQDNTEKILKVADNELVTTEEFRILEQDEVPPLHRKSIQNSVPTVDKSTDSRGLSQLADQNTEATGSKTSENISSQHIECIANEEILDGVVNYQVICQDSQRLVNCKGKQVSELSIMVNEAVSKEVEGTSKATFSNIVKSNSRRQPFDINIQSISKQDIEGEPAFIISEDE